MAEFLTTLPFAEAENLYLTGRDGIDIYVKVNDYSDDPYFEDTENSYLNLNTITFDAYTFSGANIKSLKLHYEAGLLNDALALDTLTAEIVSLTPITVSRYTPITVKRGEKIMGIFYNGQIKQVGVNIYSLYAESVISLLDYDYHPGGIYAGTSTGTVIAQIMGDIPYTVHDEIAAIKMYGYLPYDTKRANLQQILLATGAAIVKDADGSINITALSSNVVNTFSAARVFEAGDMDVDTQITAIQVTEHTYLETTDAITLYEESFTDQKLITFSEPAHSLVCTNGTIVESSANHAVIQGSGSVVLTGKKYNHTTKVITKGDLTNAPDDKIYTVSDATLVGPFNSSSVAKRLYEYARCNQTVKQDVLIDNERPGDIVQIVNPHGDDLLPAAVQSFDISLSNSMRATGSFLVGYMPVGITSGYKNRVLIDADGAWTVPAGITEMRVVVIGGGAGGNVGENGKPGNKGAISSSYNNVTCANGGDGGDGGDGGIGGNVYDVVLNVVPGQTFSVEIGSGGASGTAGNATTFGAASSAFGAPGPYMDVVSGDLYAMTGIKGIGGGQGGKVTNQDKYSVWYKGTSTWCGERGLRNHVNISNFLVVAGGGGGGGAAAGTMGDDGEDGSASRNGGVGFGDGGNGATGAVPVAADDASIYGSGGQGGHGGGGGGGGGNVHHGGNSSGNVWLGQGGAGGAGGAGGKGAPGCVIIYY